MHTCNEPPVATNGNAAPLLAALSEPALYPHPVRRVEIMQTHISWVLLTGDYAYKIKKPVDLGFLDFTTLAARRHYCEEELRLNRRLAPGLYLEVVPITGTVQRPAIGGDGPTIEYAVKMREFAQSALLDNALPRGEVGPAMIEALACRIADFHAQLAPQDATPGHDADSTVLAPARENFAQMLPLIDTPADIATLTAIRDWTRREFDARAAQFSQRYAAGCVRECHGDLHLGNIVLLDGAAVPFDCLEFNAALRWMDVMNEVAFLMMDLEAHGRRDLAFAFASTYLETSGDYAGVRLLPFYIVYRAVVRAKINLIRAAQPGITPGQRRHALAGYQRYITLAAAHTRGSRGAVVITHGLSGSGKTTLTRQLLATLGAVRIRSDVERKRLHGLHALARTGSATGAGIYADETTALTYDRLLRHARPVAGAGLPALVDATFLKHEQRAAFHALAVELGVPFAILNVTATPAALRARESARAARGGDASEATLAVLDAQIENCEVLTTGEMRHAVPAAHGTAATERAFCDQLAQRLNQPVPAYVPA
jgi:hypothetical protein